MPPTAATAHNGIGLVKPGMPETVALAKSFRGIASATILLYASDFLIGKKKQIHSK